MAVESAHASLPGDLLRSTPPPMENRNLHTSRVHEDSPSLLDSLLNRKLGQRDVSTPSSVALRIIERDLDGRTREASLVRWTIWTRSPGDRSRRKGSGGSEVSVAGAVEVGGDRGALAVEEKGGDEEEDDRVDVESEEAWPFDERSEEAWLLWRWFGG